MHIVTVVGSLHAGSQNLRLIEQLEAELGAGVSFSRAPPLDLLPFFNPDLDGSLASLDVGAFRALIQKADLCVIACPEYGHSLPGVLKNAIDWLIPSGELHEKKVIATAAVGHAERGLLGLQALRQTLLAVKADLRHCAPSVNLELGPITAKIIELASSVESSA